MTELAYRENEGIEVALWWNRTSGELKVSVRDRTTGETFEVAAPAGEALDVFNHPYAYASSPAPVPLGVAAVHASAWSDDAA